MPTLHTAQWLLRRLASRCIRVHARQRHKSPGLAAFDNTLPVFATRYMELFDALRQRAKVRKAKHHQGKRAIAKLLQTMRIWTPVVARDIRAVRTSEFGMSASVPDDVLRDAKELARYAVAHRDRAGNPLSYAQTLEQDIGAAIAIAEAQWDEAEEAQESYGALREELVEAGVSLQTELVAYRKTLKAVIGRTSPDYMKLRTGHVRTADNDDDDLAAALPQDRRWCTDAAGATSLPLTRI
jgi:hypothetical protein